MRLIIFRFFFFLLLFIFFNLGIFWVFFFIYGFKSDGKYDI